jgi:hypothetical protein
MAQDDGRGDAVIAPKLDLFNDEFTATVVPDDNSEVVESGSDDSPEVVTPAAPVRTSGGKVTRTVDLGDGSGKQVFSADSTEELLDVLTTAQENATRKIQEQQFELKRASRAKPERVEPRSFVKKELTADEIFKIANTFPSDPAAAMDAISKAKTGLTFEEIGQFVGEFMQAQLVAKAETTFLLAHQEDYIPSAQNAQRIEKFLADEKLTKTAANLEYAFQELTEGGVLDVAAPDPSKVAVKPHTRTKPMSTGLRQSNASARPVDPAIEAKSAVSESEVEEIYKLPVEEARIKMQKLMQRAKASSGSR